MKREEQFDAHGFDWVMISFTREEVRPIREEHERRREADPGVSLQDVIRDMVRRATET